MNNLVTNTIEFPEFTGVKCNMMPFIQGDSSSLPEIYQPYADIINANYLEHGEIGFLTIDESFVDAGESQRGFSSLGSDRNVHIEVGSLPDNKSGWGNSWNRSGNTLLEDNTMVLIANSISDTCRVWDAHETSYTADGDLAEYLDKYPVETGQLMKSGEVTKISIFTPHECIDQSLSGNRQFFRIVGKGVTGRESYFTTNPNVTYN